MNPKNDKILNLFAEKMRAELDPHLKQLILFGSRARGDFTPDSDYDCLAVVDEDSPEIKAAISEIAGDFLYQHDALFSIFPILEEKYSRKRFDPFLMNIRKEGVEIL